MREYYLTERQEEVARLLLFSNKEIAKMLTIEVATVKSTVHAILKKTKASTRAEILIRLVKSKDISIEDIVIPNEKLLLA